MSSKQRQQPHQEQKQQQRQQQQPQQPAREPEQRHQVNLPTLPEVTCGGVAPVLFGSLDGGLQKQVKRAIFGRAQELFNKVGSRSLRSQAKRLDKVEESMAAALKKKGDKLVARFTGGGLRAALGVLARVLPPAVAM